MDILNYLQNNRDRMMLDLEALVNHESPSLVKELSDECAQFLKQLITERLGIEVNEYACKDVGNHLKFEFGEGQEQLLILTHYDTVWEKGRLQFRIEDARAYGPGILDMKGGIIQAIWALKAIKDLHKKANFRIVTLITSDEEQSSMTSRGLIEAEAIQSKAVFVMEPAEAKTGALKTARKGVGRFRLIAEGISSHAGNHPDFHASAVHELALQISHMESIADPEKGTTINVGVIRGGTMSNVIAERAEAEIDVRFSNNEEGERVEKALINLIPRLTKTNIKVEGGIRRPAMSKSAQSHQLFELAKECAHELGFSITEASVGGASDGNFTAALGVPTLDGMGAVGEGPHAIHEHVLMDEIPKRSALVANMILKL